VKRPRVREFFSRELSWLEFNARVLSEAREESLPLLERLSFLCIVASNFDEFFMVRVAGLKRLAAERPDALDPSGLAPAELLEAISARSREIIDAQYETLSRSVLPGLAKAGLRFTRPRDWTPAQRAYLEAYFMRDVFHLLSPVRAPASEGLPPIGNLRIHAAFLLDGGEGGPDLALAQLPPGSPRFIKLPSEDGREDYALLEDLAIEWGAALFQGRKVRERACVRLTRDADFAGDEERDEDFLSAMREVLVDRQSSAPVRLAFERGGEAVAGILGKRLGLAERDLYAMDGPLDLGAFMPFASQPGRSALRNEEWPPLPSAALSAEEPIWEALKRGDALLFTPYESFDPVVRFISEAADDPDVLAIKMTLYRTSGDSPIVKALERAAMKGKQVTAVVELKARFDEDKNISWAGRLERAGAIVVHGIARLKVHAKAAMVLRREADGVRPYLHLSTGNYNDRTARIYSDLSLFTAESGFCYEASLFFNAITGYSEAQAGKRLTMAPFHLRDRIIALIDREIARKSQEYPGLIVAKLNALTDIAVIRALYRASRAGVTVRLNVRGICALAPGVKGLSENVSVTSVVDRYLEHSRIVYFANGGAEELYLSSADWMERNLDKRIELLFPVLDRACRERALWILKRYFDDNRNAHDLQPDGAWTRRSPARGETPFRAQEGFRRFYEGLSAAAEAPSPLLEVRRSKPGAES